MLPGRSVRNALIEADTALTLAVRLSILALLAAAPAAAPAATARASNALMSSSVKVMVGMSSSTLGLMRTLGVGWKVRMFARICQLRARNGEWME